MRYTIAFAKRQEVRFLSHLETARVFERALRRAGLPLLLSQGFNPHPYLSFASPLSVGLASRSEYLEVELAQALPPGLVGSHLQAELPEGFKIKGVTTSPPGNKTLSSLVEIAAYVARPYWEPDPGAAAIKDVVAALLALEEVKIGEKGREKDIRDGIFHLRPKSKEGRVSLTMLLAAGGRLHVRPERVLEAIAGLGGWHEGKPALVWRAGLYTCRDKNLVPLGLSRGALSR